MMKIYDLDSASTLLVESLAQVNFGHRYFEYYEQTRTRMSQLEYKTDRKSLEVIVAETGLEFRYFSKERFFRHAEKRPGYDLMLHIAFPYSTVEYGLYMEGNWGVAGSVWPRLARQVIQTSEPTFNPSPASPKLPFSNEADLREIVSFGNTLFNEIRDIIISFDK